MKHFTLKSKYLVLFIFLFITEVLIAKFVHDQFIRPFVGDILVVVLIYCFLKIFLKFDSKKIAISVFIFACSVELLQLFHIVKLLHFEHNKLIKIAIGSVFDIKDIFAYFIGYLICLYDKTDIKKDTVYKS